MFTIRWHSHAVKKRGENAKWQRRKRAKTVNNLVICDNKYNRAAFRILAIADCIDGNHHDSFEIIEQVQKMIDSLDKQQINYKNAHLNADSGFDVKKFIEFVENKQLVANIKENKRNTKQKTFGRRSAEYRYMSEYIYSFRFKIECVFAWLDTYKRILIRFDVIPKNFKSWLSLASAMINFRHLFN
jgi:transposase